MLIQITNKCHMGCKHCMQDSTPKGKHMTNETFGQVIDFCMKSRPVIVSVTGGEPTEHPNWAEYVKSLYALPSVKCVAITTNGAWVTDEKQYATMAELVMRSMGGVQVQVYSNPKHYPNHEWTVEHADRFRSIGIEPDFESPTFIQDLGRAHKNCQQEAAESLHAPSCINTHLIARQSRTFGEFFSKCILAAKFCRPLIDINGSIHMSESWLCPAVAHVRDGVAEALRKMQTSTPCGRCRLYKNFEQRFPVEMKILKK